MIEHVQSEKKLVQITKVLQLVLFINAFTSGVFGLVLLLFGDIVGNLAGLDYPTTIRIVGLGLLIFIAFVYWASRQKEIPANMLLFFGGIDLIWVIGSLLLVILLSLTTIGMIGILLVAIVVAVFSFYELYFYRANQR